MDEERNLVERGGGYVVLLIVTAVLFFGWRTGLVGGLGETEGQRPFLHLITRHRFTRR